MIPSFPVAGLMLAAPRGAALGVDILLNEPFYEAMFRVTDKQV
jgi:hypothetical protein